MLSDCPFLQITTFPLRICFKIFGLIYIIDPCNFLIKHTLKGRLLFTPPGHNFTRAYKMKLTAMKQQHFRYAPDQGGCPYLVYWQLDANDTGLIANKYEIIVTSAF